MMLRIATKRLLRFEQRNPHRPPGLRQRDGDNEAIAAIVAGTAQYGHGSRSPAAGNFARDGLARLLHQQRTRRACRHRQPIGLVHLRNAEKFAVHSAPTAAPTAVVTAIASALQKATRKAATLTGAPPTFADHPPRKSRQASDAAAIADMECCAGARAAAANGRAAPIEKLPAEAAAASSG